eukprot:5648872-Karenia_brevis.AAC.1
MFGDDAFTYGKSSPPWVVFCKNELRAVPDNMARHFHGTKLNQFRKILDNGFARGMHHRGSWSSPCGIWGCTREGDALDRCHLSRGWSKEAGEVALSGWDCPVALCIH